MQGATGIKVTGFEETNRALKAIGLPNREINLAGREAGKIVLKEARPLVPVRTGALLKTLRISTAARATSVTAGNENTVPYSNPIHWGWSQVGVRHKGTAATWQRKNIKPQPFFARALGFTRKEILEAYNRQIKKLIDDQSAKGTIK